MHFAMTGKARILATSLHVYPESSELVSDITIFQHVLSYSYLLESMCFNDIFQNAFGAYVLAT